MEYKYAADWFSELYTLIGDGCNAPCWIIFSPGNHDVDHSANRPMRGALLEQIRKDPALSLDDGIVAECTKEQVSFFDFCKSMESEDILRLNDPLLRIHRIRDEKSTIQFNVFNSAWMSEINETPGNIVFPIDRFQENLRTPNGFSISVIHHPFGWFVPENARELRSELAACSSIIFCGHEHMPDNTQLSTQLGDNVQIVDGGMLRGDNQNVSAFNLLLLDTTASKVKGLTLCAQNDRYEPGGDAEWRDATRLTSSESTRFRLRDEMRVRLEDLDANILHPRHEHLRLADIFVYPDLLSFNSDVVGKRDAMEHTVSSETLIFRPDLSHTLIEGDEGSGKSSLLRFLFAEFYRRGKVPLYLNGSAVRKYGDDALRNALRREFAKTYTGDRFIHYEQLSSSDRVLLIDDYNFNETDPSTIEANLRFIHEFAAKAIVISRNLLSLERYATTRQGSTILQEYDTFFIQEFGHVKRDELIKRWILLGRQSREWELPATIGERSRMRQVFNTTMASRQNNMIRMTC